MGFTSQSITDKRVYAQDTTPVDTRNGIIWVDTSQNPPQTKVYSSDSSNWESVRSKTTQVQHQNGGYRNIYHSWTGTGWENIDLSINSYDGFQIRRTASGMGSGWDWEIIDMDGNTVDNGSISVSDSWVSVNFPTIALETFRIRTQSDSLETEIDIHENSVPYHLHVI